MSLKILALGLAIFGVSAGAMPVASQMIRPRAYLQEADGNLLEALDLKSKTIRLTKKDFDRCGQGLKRQGKTLAYSCSLEIPSKAVISRFQQLLTPQNYEISFGASKRRVYLSIAPDARSITVSTSFDATGVDFEMLKFNDDLFQILDKSALLIITDALLKKRIRFEVLESPQNLNLYKRASL